MWGTSSAAISGRRGNAAIRGISCVLAMLGCATSAFALNGSMNNSFIFRPNYTTSQGQITDDNIGATKESGEPNHAGWTGGKSVWISWTAPGNGEVTIDTNGSTFDTVLGVYTGTSFLNFVTVASNDDHPSFFWSRVTFNAVAGTTYQIAVDGVSGTSGNIVLNWNQPVKEPPATSLQTGQEVRIWSVGGYCQELFYNFTTTASSVSPVVNSFTSVTYPVWPYDQWVGVFHYDYFGNGFSQAQFFLRNKL